MKDRKNIYNLKLCCNKVPYYWGTWSTQPPDYDWEATAKFWWCIKCEICGKEYDSPVDANDVIARWNRGEHFCKESSTCTCHLLASEPDEKCPVHGVGKWPPRCKYCGRFMKRRS